MRGHLHARICDVDNGRRHIQRMKQMALGTSYVAIGVRLELSFLAAAASASFTAWIVRFFSSSISCALAPRVLLGVDLLKMTVLWGLGAPIEPVCGAATLTIGVVVESPR